MPDFGRYTTLVYGVILALVGWFIGVIIFNKEFNDK